MGTPPRHLVDLGSGGGLPGLVLAEHWPNAEGLLLDSSERRTTFLNEAIAELGLSSRFRVVRARAEDFGRQTPVRGTADLVVARSFGPPPVTAECAAPLLVVGGLLVVSEPPDAPEHRWSSSGLAQLGLEPLSVWRAGGTYRSLVQRRLCPSLYPRPSGVPTRRPLWRST